MGTLRVRPGAVTGVSRVKVRSAYEMQIPDEIIDAIYNAGLSEALSSQMRQERIRKWREVLI